MSKFIKISIFLPLLLTQVCFVVNQANAATKTNLNFTPEITVGTFKAGTPVAVSASTETIGQYIKQIYQYAIGVVAILAVVVMMIGGVLWMTAGGNQTQVSNAKSWISSSLLGLLLVMGSYVILKTINPDLVNFKIHTIQPITLSTASNSNASNITGCCQEGASSDKSSYSICFNVVKKDDCGSNDYINGTRCEQLSSCPGSYNCSGTSVDGMACAGGYCYDGVCETSDGSAGQKCGPAGNIGICTIAPAKQYTPCGAKTHVSGGRDCDGYNNFCCK